jgi:SAM-dependent methyltransferase
MPAIDMNRALTFGQVADAYARYRPGYPDEAVSWLAPPAPGRVADVGAGTGQLTESLLARGLAVEAVEAVEPDPEMLAVLAKNFPAARPHCSGADAIPADDGTLDAVLVADARHWFPQEATIAEVRRVLKPWGRLGLVWNMVTPVESWEFEVAGTDPDQKGTTGQQTFPFPFPENETEVERFPWTWDVTPHHYAAALATNSAVIAMDDRERAARMATACSLLQRVCDDTGRTSLPFRHQAYCVRWTPQ